MALKIADRVRETSTTTGTGPLTLNGAVSGYRRFSDVLSVGDTCWYVITMGADFEIGTGTYSAANTLTRTTPAVSTNGNAAVAFAAGSKDVFIDAPASLAALIPALQSDIVLGTDNKLPVTAATLAGLVSHRRQSLSAAYTVVATDRGSLLECSGSFTISLTAAATLSARHFFDIANTGTGQVVLQPNGSETIDGLAFVMLQPGDAFRVSCSGTGFRTIGRMTSRGAPDLIVEEQRPSGSNGSAASTTGFDALVLNTVTRNTLAGASLASNIVTLPAGTYFCQFMCPLYNAGMNAFQQSRLYNITDSAVAVLGSSDFGSMPSFGAGAFTIASQKTFQLEHYASASSRFGIGGGKGTEVFARLQIWRLNG